jgi:hypothetical protein
VDPADLAATRRRRLILPTDDSTPGNACGVCGDRITLRTTDPSRFELSCPRPLHRRRFPKNAQRGSRIPVSPCRIAGARSRVNCNEMCPLVGNPNASPSASTGHNRSLDYHLASSPHDGQRIRRPRGTRKGQRECSVGRCYSACNIGMTVRFLLLSDIVLRLLRNWRHDDVTHSRPNQ